MWEGMGWRGYGGWATRQGCVAERQGSGATAALPVVAREICILEEANCL